MPKRPDTRNEEPERVRSHELEAMSRTRLRSLFEEVGWTVQDISHDYGEDLLVRIFNNGNPTPWFFYVQAKATDKINEYLLKDNRHLSYPIKQQRLNNWNKFWEPVLLTVWDSAADTTYWISIQEYTESNEIDITNRKTISIRIPIVNVLDVEALKVVAALTIRRFTRFEREYEGAQALIALLEETLNIDIDYAPQLGVLFVGFPNGGGAFSVFGKFGELIANRAEEMGRDPEEYIRTKLFQETNNSQEDSIESESSVMNRDENIIKHFDMDGKYYKDLMEEFVIENINIDGLIKLRNRSE